MDSYRDHYREIIIAKTCFGGFGSFDYVYGIWGCMFVLLVISKYSAYDDD